MSKFQISRRQARIGAMIYLYQYLVYKKVSKKMKVEFDLKKFISENTNDLNPILEEQFSIEDYHINIIDNDLFTGIIKQLNDVDTIILKLDEYLDDSWEFNRLSMVEQALLITSYIQITNKDVDSKIIINESIEIAKEYCDDESYKFINATLDAIINDFKKL